MKFPQFTILLFTWSFFILISVRIKSYFHSPCQFSLAQTLNVSPTPKLKRKNHKFALPSIIVTELKEKCKTLARSYGRVPDRAKGVSVLFFFFLIAVLDLEGAPGQGAALVIFFL